MTTTPARQHDATNSTHPPSYRPPARRGPARTVGRWLVSFLGFPLGGYAAILVVGPMHSTTTALAGGAITGAVLGLAQAWAFGPSRPSAATWVLSTAVGLSVGSASGAAATDYTTDVASLVGLGAVTGLSVGITQGVVLLRRLGTAALMWPVVLTGSWALGWRISEAVIGSSVDQHFYVFGASGAVVVATLTSPLAVVLDRRTPVGSRSSAASAARRTS